MINAAKTEKDKIAVLAHPNYKNFDYNNIQNLRIVNWGKLLVTPVIHDYRYRRNDGWFDYKLAKTPTIFTVENWIHAHHVNNWLQITMNSALVLNRVGRTKVNPSTQLSCSHAQSVHPHHSLVSHVPSLLHMLTPT